MKALHSDTPTLRNKNHHGTFLGVLVAVVLFLPDILFLLNLFKPKADPNDKRTEK